MHKSWIVFTVSLLASPASASPLSIAEAVETALRENPSIRGALATAQAAQARIGQARSNWLPQVTASSQVRADTSYQTGVAQGAEAVNTLRYSGGLQLSQLIYDFGRTSARIGGAEAGTAAAQADSETIRSQVALRAIGSFYSVLQAEALREVSRRTLEQQQQRRLQAESFFRIGTRPEIDVLIARTAVANAELALVQSESSVYTARTQLLEALGIQSEQAPQENPRGAPGSPQAWLERPLMSVASPPLAVESSDPPIDTLLDEALRHRPDYAAGRERVRQAESTVAALRGDYLPQLSLGVNGQLSGSIGGLTVGTVGGTSRLDVPTAGQPGFGLTGSLSLSWPLISGLATVYGLREAHANLQSARASLDALRLSMRSQLLAALYQLRAALRSVQAAQALATQAGRQLEMARGRYQAGVGNAIELGDASVTAASAQAQRVQAEYALYGARATLLWHLGQLIPTQRPISPPPL